MPEQCVCEAPASVLRLGRWICTECDLDTDPYREDEH